MLLIEGEALMMQRVMVCLPVLIGLLWLSSVANAADCGTAAEGGKDEPVVGTLLLKPEDSVTELSFKRDTEPRRLIFEFDVTECKLPTDADLEAKVRSADMSVSSVFGKPVIEPEGSSLAVEVPVDPNGFDAGKHSASVTIRGATVTPTTAKVSLQRSSSAVGPTIVTILCVLAGFFGALAKCRPTGNGQEKLKVAFFIGAALFAAVVAAGVVWWTSYLKVDTWKWELETVIALVVGAAPAAYGAAIGALQVKPD